MFHNWLKALQGRAEPNTTSATPETAPDYLYPELVPSLSLLPYPEVYEQARQGRDVWDLKENPVQYTDYWALLPRFTFAHCPICRQRFHASADPFSLVVDPSSHLNLLKSLYRGPEKRPWCPHFLGIHQFLNLHEVKPYEVPRVANRTGEVPYLTPWFFLEDVPGYAVLHALPICRTEGERLIPRYTRFSLSYFCTEPQAVLKRRNDEELVIAHKDSEYYGAELQIPGESTWRTANYNRTTYDLPRWADKGLVGWVDWTQPDSPLQIGPGTQLPPLFQHIRGRRWTYRWQRGAFIPDRPADS